MHRAGCHFYFPLSSKPVVYDLDARLIVLPIDVTPRDRPSQEGTVVSVTFYDTEIVFIQVCTFIVIHYYYYYCRCPLAIRSLCTGAFRPRNNNNLMVQFLVLTVSGRDLGFMTMKRILPFCVGTDFRFLVNLYGYTLYNNIFFYSFV